MLTISAIPAFNDNYIWCLADSNTNKALIVDPGQAKPVQDYLVTHGLTLDTILVTHHHPDHVGGVKAWLKALLTAVSLGLPIRLLRVAPALSIRAMK